MRVKKFDARVIYLTEKEWRETLKRFDLSKVVKKGDDIYEIPSDGCYLCEKYRTEARDGSACYGCPLDSEVGTCRDLMEVIVGDSFAFHAEVLSGVWWGDYGEGQNARAHIKKVYEALMKMERVKRRIR